MQLDRQIEEKIKKEVVGYLEKGREDWDVPHTYSAVKWMKKLVAEEGGNEKILETAMYLHDVGVKEMKKGYDVQEVQYQKEGHAEKGARLGREILEKIGGYSEEEIDEICDLVRQHDQHDNIDSHERQLVFEADGLAQIDWYNCAPNFNKENCLKWLDVYFEKERPEERWKTKTGKAEMLRLKEECYHYWDNK